MTGKIIRIAGSLVVARGLENPKMFDLVLVGGPKLIGEIIKLKADTVFIQVYEETAGIRVGEEVINTSTPLSVELGPGLLSSIYDGVQRPLPVLEKASGSFIGRGVSAPGLPRQARWHFTPQVKKDELVQSGDILGAVQEKGILHRILVPPGIAGNVKDIKEGDFTVEEPIAKISLPLNPYPLTL